MAKRSKIESILTDDERMELANNLKGSGWGELDRWTDWLNSRGLEISRSAVGRFNQKRKAQFEKAWASAEETAMLAKVLVANRQNDSAAVMQANELLASDGLLRTQMALNDLEEQIADMESDEEARNITLAVAKARIQVMRGVKDLNQAGIAREKWLADLNAKLQTAMEKATPIAKKAGLSDEDWAAIRANFLGVEVEA